MKTYKIVSMNADTKDTVLGVSVISKKTFEHLSIEKKEVIGVVSQKEKLDKQGNAIEPSIECSSILEIGNIEKKIYEENPTNFLHYIEVDDGSFLKVIKSI